MDHSLAYLFRERLNEWSQVNARQGTTASSPLVAQDLWSISFAPFGSYICWAICTWNRKDIAAQVLLIEFDHTVIIEKEHKRYSVVCSCYLPLWYTGYTNLRGPSGGTRLPYFSWK